MKRNQFRNGQVIRETAPKDGRPQGLERVWHRNGIVAEETPFDGGVMHGLCRRWAEDGTLLGEFHIEHGTGLQRRWYANGQLAAEIQTVRGSMSGRTRNWLRDGTLVAVTYYLENTPVTRERYEAAAEDPALAKYSDTDVNPFDVRGTMDFEKVDHAEHVEELLHAARRDDALKWLNAVSARQMGDSADPAALRRMVGDILEAGATKAVATRIYSDKAGKEFCDHLVIGLPDETVSRAAIRQCCGLLLRMTGGALLPKDDMGERHLLLLSA